MIIHFDGEWHCVECQGRCQLLGDSLELTRFVRNICEYFAFNGWTPSQVEAPLSALYGDRWHDFRRRALNSMKKFRIARDKAD
jgi:hypothetical protein